MHYGVLRYMQVHVYQQNKKKDNENSFRYDKLTY